jgi:hypothetical protein
VQAEEYPEALTTYYSLLNEIHRLRGEGKDGTHPAIEQLMKKMKKVLGELKES